MTSGLGKSEKQHELDSFERRDIELWSDCLWKYVIEPSKSSGNPSSQHDCCSAFTTRTATKSAEHPSSVSIWGFLKNNEIKNAKDLCNWIIADFNKRVGENKPAFLPSLNTIHRENIDDEVEFVKSGDLEKEFLRRYLDVVVEEHADTRLDFLLQQGIVKDLKEEIKKLKNKPRKTSDMDSEQDSNLGVSLGKRELKGVDPKKLEELIKSPMMTRKMKANTSLQAPKQA